MKKQLKAFIQNAVAKEETTRVGERDIKSKGFKENSKICPYCFRIVTKSNEYGATGVCIACAANAPKWGGTSIDVVEDFEGTVRINFSKTAKMLWHIESSDNRVAEASAEIIGKKSAIVKIKPKSIGAAIITAKIDLNGKADVLTVNVIDNMEVIPRASVIDVGDTVDISAKINDDRYNCYVDYLTEDAGVLRIGNSKNEFIGLKPGNTKIRVRAYCCDNSYIEKRVEVTVRGVKISNDTKMLSLTKDKEQLSCNCYGLDPSKVVWVSSDESVGRIDSNMSTSLRLVDQGLVTVTAHIKSDEGKLYADSANFLVGYVSAIEKKPKTGNNTYIQRVIDNIRKCSASIIYESKKDICIAIASQMLARGYDLAFVSGVLANIMFEGNVGQFESSNYISNPKPDYLYYMDNHYKGVDFYLDNYSGKTVMDVNVHTVWNMLSEIRSQSHDTWRIGNSRVGFGMGCIQWSFNRAYLLACIYKMFADEEATITTEQATSAEVLMLINELNSRYFNWIAPTWSKDCEDINSASAASCAGAMLCKRYIMPYNTEQEAIRRGERAEAIYMSISR